MLGPRYFVGWAVVGAVATSVGVGTVFFVRDAEGANSVVNALSPADVLAQYSAAQKAGVTGSPLGTDPSATVPTDGPSSGKAGSRGPTPSAGATGTHPSATRSAGPPGSTTSPSSRPTPTASPTSTSITRLLSSQGGSVVAQCTGSRGASQVYLVSWSPAQGYTIDQVQRGPSQEAQIEFASSSTSVSVNIHCTSSGPVQTVEAGDSWAPGGGGGGGGGGEGDG